jgi:hypothetical protein
MKPVRPFCHLIEFDKARSMAIINRLFKDGTKVLYVEIPISTAEEGSIESAFRNYAQRIGEDIILDSPEARSMLGIE